MAKTKEELELIRKDCEDLSLKLGELSEEELKEVAGGSDLSGFLDILKKIGKGIKSVTEPVVKSFIG